MTIYVLMFLIPLSFSLYSYNLDDKVKKLFWLVFGVLLILIIGLRHEIGVDWEAYKRHYDLTVNEKLQDIIFTSDIAYASLNWFIALFSGKVYTVNFLCSIIFVYGLISFCRKQQSPGIAFIVAIPILVLIVGMSYTRQSVAVGIELLALPAIISGNNKKFIILIIIASLFHFSAIFLLTLVAFVSIRNKVFIALGIFFLGGMVAVGLKFQTQEALIDLYYNQKLSSDGGIYRIALNLIPATLILFFLNKSKLKVQEFNLWQTLSIMSLMCFPLINIIPTATDRIFIYLIPVQIFVYSNLRLWFINKQMLFIAEFGVVLFQFVLMIVWLLFGNYNDSWVPYKMFPFL